MKEQISKRIRNLRKEAQMSQDQVAAKVGVSRVAVSKWESGDTKNLKTDNLFSLASVFGMSVDELVKGSDAESSFAQELDPGDEYTAIERVRFKLSAGVTGYAIEPENGTSAPVFFRKDWFVTHNYKPEKLLAVKVHGQSMEPSLWDGDLVVVNTADTLPQDGECFALNYEGELVIKRMRRDAGQWFATSDNSDQRRFAPKQCTEDVCVIGRIVYKQSERI